MGDVSLKNAYFQDFNEQIIQIDCRLPRRPPDNVVSGTLSPSINLSGLKVSSEKDSFFLYEGNSDNSPAFQCRKGKKKSRKGRLTGYFPHSAVPFRTKKRINIPAVETTGYYWSSSQDY